MKNNLEWLFVIVCVVSLGVGLFLGGLIVNTSNALIERMMIETREDLRKHKNSVVLVDKQLAEFVGYVPAKKDIVIKGGAE